MLITAAILVSACGIGLLSGVPADDAPAVPFPHPMITEILYAVPGGKALEGDASGDGVRHATGDEFIEIINPHDKPIALAGYRLCDTGSGNSITEFTFPACELPPGGIAVVFNGNRCKWKGPVGDAKAAPAGPNESFGGAKAFTMKYITERAALSNDGDVVHLYAPDGKLIHRVHWGDASPGDGSGILEEQAFKVHACSIQREGLGKGKFFKAHTSLPVDQGGGPEARYSPGLYGKPTPPRPASAPPPATTPAPTAPKPAGA